MDTSELYIKMCGCRAVQSHFKVIEGDWLFCKCDDITDYPDGYGITVITSGDADCGNLDLKDSKSDVWLPRQDQIQILLRQFYAEDSDRPDAWFPEGSIGLSLVLRKFDEFTMRKNGEVTLFVENTKSFEQLWLQLYMSEVHGKLWIREGWV